VIKVIISFLILKNISKNMLQIAIVVFREILEIALILGILIAATKEIQGRTKWIVSGLVCGIISAIILAFFTDSISKSLHGMGEEFFNGLILMTAAFMLGWTILWMQKHSKSLSGELKRLGNSVKEGRKPAYTLFIVVLLTVLREGTEITLFSYSYYISGTAVTSIVSGIALGIFLGASLGLALYLGLLRAFGKHFFAVTSWMLIFLAAGIAAAGIGFWINAEIIVALGDPAIDLSGILSQSSIFGKFLNMFFGYIDRPAGMQLIVYFSTLAVLATGLRIAKKI
jgi:high-affinity iron transporter